MVTPLILLEGAGLRVAVGSLPETVDRGIGLDQGGI